MIFDRLCITEKPNAAFKPFINKKGRKLNRQNSDMREVHRAFLAFLKIQDIHMPSAYGTGGKARNLWHRFLQHRDKDTGKFQKEWYILDLADAYGHVNMEKLVGVILLTCDNELRRRSDDLLAFLMRHCSSTREKGLIQGATSSSFLFNLYLDELVDIPLERFCKAHGVTYTRYYDDFAFSGQKGTLLSHRRGKLIRKGIRKILIKAGFEINHLKSKCFDLTKKPTKVNGVLLDYYGRISLPRPVIKKMSGLLHRFVHGKHLSSFVVDGNLGRVQDIHDILEPTCCIEQRLLILYLEYYHHRFRGRVRTRQDDPF
ncbi:hypothetical protein COB55_04935 [Candidatus Wolfebacteria bacterium]|nr:MAG: hypothetical protein COB55_04935 [Candidatus Wolfebacteria bacterium]